MTHQSENQVQKNCDYLDSQPVSECHDFIAFANCLLHVKLYVWSLVPIWMVIPLYDVQFVPQVSTFLLWWTICDHFEPVKDF